MPLCLFSCAPGRAHPPGSEALTDLRRAQTKRAQPKSSPQHAPVANFKENRVKIGVAARFRLLWKRDVIWDVHK